MLKKIVYRLLRHRHFWRDASFDELSELYISMMFRSLALSLMGIFIPVFLFTNGYGIPQILSFFIFFFATRAAMDIVGGLLVARVGPKHTMVVSYCSQIAAALLFLSLPNQHWPLAAPAVLWAISISFFFIAFHVDFSKVKHSKHGGKELCYVNVMERIGGALGPIVGGLVAVAFGAQYIFLAAIGLLVIGLIPLFKTSEPVQTRQRLDFKGLPLGTIKRDLFSYCALTVENNLCVMLWPLFLAAFVFTSQVYLKLGGLMSIGVLVSIGAAFVIGKLIDQRQGGLLLRIGTMANALIHLIRPFVSNLPMALAVGITNEVVTVGYRIPYYKGMYDAADGLPGHRIVYMVSMESFGSFTKLLVWAELYCLSFVVAPRTVLVTGFMIAAAASLLIMTERFKALEYAKKG